MVPQVNARLERQEEDGKDGDPAFPKQQWPPADLCPLCHLPSSQVSQCLHISCTGAYTRRTPALHLMQLPRVCHTLARCIRVILPHYSCGCACTCPLPRYSEHSRFMKFFLSRFSHDYMSGFCHCNWKMSVHQLHTLVQDRQIHSKMLSRCHMPLCRAFSYQGHGPTLP